MQAIETKYLGPTDTRGGRIKAECERGSITVNCDGSSDIERQHVEAAEALVAKFAKEDAARYGTKKNPWQRGFISGGLKNGNYAHVLLPYDPRTGRTMDLKKV